VGDTPLTARGFEVTEDGVQRLYDARGWTDGLPIVPPTTERVQAMLRGSDREPDTVLGIIPPRYGEATVENVAINAVLAGCEPTHLPLVLLAVEAMCHEEFNLLGIQATTHLAAPLLVFNGPIPRELHVNGGYNCFGQGHAANALIGRAVRLVLTNVGGAVPGKLDRATFGSPAKFAYCVAENEAASPWAPLHVERGHDAAVSTVTVIGAEAPHNVNDHGSISAEGVLTTIAGAMSETGSNNTYYRDEGPWVVLSPEHADVIARDGWSKADVKRFLFERSQIPIERFSRENVERFLLQRWSARLQEEVAAWLRTGAAGVRVPLSDGPEGINVFVAGGAGKHSLFIPTFGATRSVTLPLTRRDGQPAQDAAQLGRP
jgi:hypothetical protein